MAASMNPKTNVSGKVYVLSIKEEDSWDVPHLFSILAIKGPRNSMSWGVLKGIIEKDNGFIMQPKTLSETISPFGELLEDLDAYITENIGKNGGDPKRRRDRVYNFTEVARAAYEEGVLNSPVGLQKIEKVEEKAKRRSSGVKSLNMAETVEQSKEVKAMANSVEVAEFLYTVPAGGLQLLSQPISGGGSVGVHQEVDLSGESVEDSGQSVVSSGPPLIMLDEAASDVEVETYDETVPSVESGRAGGDDKVVEVSTGELDEELNSILAIRPGNGSSEFDALHTMRTNTENLVKKYKAKLDMALAANIRLMGELDIQQRMNQDFRAAAASEIVAGLKPEMQQFMASGEKIKTGMVDVAVSMKSTETSVASLVEKVECLSSRVGEVKTDDDSVATLADKFEALSARFEEVNSAYQADQFTVLSGLVAAGILPPARENGGEGEEDEGEEETPVLLQSLQYVAQLLEFSGFTVGGEAVNLGTTLQTMTAAITSLVEGIEGMKKSLTVSAPSALDLKTPPPMTSEGSGVNAPFKRPSGPPGPIRSVATPARGGAVVRNFKRTGLGFGRGAASPRPPKRPALGVFDPMTPPPDRSAGGNGPRRGFY